MKGKIKYMILGALLTGVTALSGCGVSHKSPEGVAESLIEAYGSSKESAVRDCYGGDKSESLQTLIDSTLAYFKAHEPEEIKIVECGIISEKDEYAYVYVTYNMVLSSKQEFPCISTYMVEKKENEYYILPPEKVTEEMSRQAAEDYAEFMTTAPYKDYVTRYEVFMTKNPGYEEKIAGKLS